MSLFLWQVVPFIGTYLRQANDERAIDPITDFIRVDYFDLDYYLPLWSSPRGIDSNIGALDSTLLRWPVMWEYDVRWQGARSKKRFTGVTKDSNGDPLSYCVVQLFRTSDDLFIMETTSDLFGNFAVYSPWDTAHYMVAYKSGAQDVAGTTKNTIVGD